MIWRAGVFALCFLAADLVKSAEDDSAISPWDFSTTVGAGAGYKDNLLLSDFNKESSMFTETTADLFLMRLPIDDGPGITLFALAEDRRYWQSTTVDKEQAFIGSFQINQKFGERWKPGFIAQYSYTDQMFDASFEGIPDRVRAKLNRFSAGPEVSVDMGGKRRIESRFTIVRQEFELPLDDSWEAGPKFLFAQKYGHGSEASAAYLFKIRTYDHLRPEVDIQNSLRQWVHEFELGNRHYWDQEKEWSSRTKLGVDWTDDNGNGFFNYRRWRVDHGVGFERGGFEGEAGVRFYHYEHESQTGFLSGVRRRSELMLKLRLERRIFEGFRTFLEYEHEWVTARDVTERYRANTVMTGVEWDIK